MRRLMGLLVLGVLILAGCARSPAPPPPTTITGMPEAPAKVSAGGASETTSAPETAAAESPATGNANPVDVPRVPQPPSSPGLYLYAVDLERGTAEQLVAQPGSKRFPVAASTDGRYLLTLADAVGDPPYGVNGHWEIFDVQANKVVATGPGGFTNYYTAWSGRGFWIDALVHLDLSGNVETYPTLRKAVGLAANQAIVGAAWQSDGNHVVLLVQRQDDAKMADLVWATADGKSVIRSDRPVQPWQSKTGRWAELCLSPDGSRLYLRAASPGTAFIHTDALTFDHWQSLSGAWRDSVTSAEGGGAPATAWSPDGRFLLEGATRVRDADGKDLWAANMATYTAIWKPDSSAFLWPSPSNMDRFRTAELVSPNLGDHAKTLPAAIDGQIMSWLPDGRLLVAWYKFE